MLKHRNVSIVAGGCWAYFKKHGFEIGYPPSRLPKCNEPDYSEAEKRLLAKPLLALAIRPH